MKIPFNRIGAFIILFFLLTSCSQFMEYPDRKVTPIDDVPPVDTIVALPTSTISVQITDVPVAQVEKSVESEWELWGRDDLGLVYDIDQSPDGSLWFATAEGVWSFDEKDWKHYQEKDGLAEDDSLAIKATRQGTVWVGSSHGKISHFDKKTWTSYAGYGGMLRDIAETEDGVVWFGVDDYKTGGVFSFDGKQWMRYSTENGLAYNSLSHVLVSRRGEVWVTTADGLSIFDRKTWRTLSLRQIWASEDELVQPGSGSMTETPDGMIWLASRDKGIARMEPDGTWKNLLGSFFNNHIFALAVTSDGTAWVGGNGGEYDAFLARLDQDGWKIITNLPFRFTNDIQPNSDGSLLLATEMGVYRYSGMISK